MINCFVALMLSTKIIISVLAIEASHNKE